jgi:hypothetical protein
MSKTENQIPITTKSHQLQKAIGIENRKNASGPSSNEQTSHNIYVY